MLTPEQISNGVLATLGGLAVYFLHGIHQDVKKATSSITAIKAELKVIKYALAQRGIRVVPEPDESEDQLPV